MESTVNFRVISFIVAILFCLAQSKPDLNRTTAPRSNRSGITTESPLTTPDSHVTVEKTTTLKATIPPTASNATHHTERCIGKKDCKSCSDDVHCYWCGSTEKCAVYPVKKIAPRHCPKNDWYWKQCFIPGYVLIIVVPSLVGLILLTCGCCIYCKCCRSSTKSWKREEKRIKKRKEERSQQHELRKRERQARQNEIRKKYGLLNAEDEEPLI